MRTKIITGILLCIFMGCTNNPQNSNVTNKSGTASNAASFVEDNVVDQSAGWRVIEALSKVYGNDSIAIGDFMDSPRCPSFLEGMFFDGPTLVFQVRGDTIQVRRMLEAAAKSKDFRLEQVTEDYYSQRQLEVILDELRRRYDELTDEKLKSNLSGWGMGLRYITVRFILNTPEARKTFREKLMDSPAIRFEGPEEPVVNERTGTADTLGISLHPEYSVYSTDASTASFVLLNRGSRQLLCGEHYFVTYEDENGIWRELPIHGVAIDIGYTILPGEHKLFAAHLYPEVHTNKPGRYRFFYEVMLNARTTSRCDILMMTEFRLTDNEQEVKKAVRMKIPEQSNGYGTVHAPFQENPSDGNTVYHVVDKMPEFPGGMKALMDFIDRNVQYPTEARKKGVQGRVVVQFVVDEDGSIITPKIVRSIEPSLDEEALRIIKMLPRWRPGALNGKVVKVKYTVPVAFKLNNQ